MSNQEHNPSNESPVGEQIPHSGVHGFEKPVTEFDKTSLRDAHEQGLIKTPETPAALHTGKDKEKKKSFPAWAKYLIGSFVASTVLGGGAIGYQAKKASDYINELNDADKSPAAGAPAVPGEDIKDAPEYHFTLEPVVLTDQEVATLKAGDSEESHQILDTKLIPKIQEAVDKIRENGSKLDGLDLSALAPSKRGLATLANLDDGKPVEICQTTPNVDGSLNFCGSNHPTKMELGKPVEFWVNDVATEKDYRFRSGSHIEVTDDNRLVLANND